MLSLKTIKKTISKKPKKEGINPEPHEELKALEIGFKVESEFDIAKRNIRKKFRFWVEEMKLSGFYTDFWMWNFVFLNIVTIFSILFLIAKYFSQLPDLIGINYDDDWAYDLLVSKNFLYIIPIFHVIVILLAIYLSIKSQKRLSHIFAAAFFPSLILLFFEILGIRNLIVYFL